MTTKVFVYGTLKKGFIYHDLLEDSVFLEERTLDGFIMYDAGFFPLVSEGEGRVRGEVYEIDDEVLGQLDRLEGHPHFYTRTKFQDLEIYLCQPQNRAVQIKSGVWNV